MGLCTTGNIVESGCKVIFTTRFKHSAMHWSVAGANKILARRGCKRSGSSFIFLTCTLAHGVRGHFDRPLCNPRTTSSVDDVSSKQFRPYRRRQRNS